MDTKTLTQAEALKAEDRAAKLGHTIGSWRMAHRDTQAHAFCIICGEQLGVLASEGSVIGRASWMACTGVA